ncbi:MAG TPA: hypothetical protein VM686_20970, partial [Polyangiaceae bacterium]|nr:hypothetical protein [Polyangiaceae bacterium]
MVLSAALLLGCAGKPGQLQRAPSAAPPAPSAAAPAPSAPAPAVVQAPPAPPAFPGVSCADANAAAQLRFFACTNDCAVHDAAA